MAQQRSYRAKLRLGMQKMIEIYRVTYEQVTIKQHYSSSHVQYGTCVPHSPYNHLTTQHANQHQAANTAHSNTAVISSHSNTAKRNPPHIQLQTCMTTQGYLTQKLRLAASASNSNIPLISSNTAPHFCKIAHKEGRLTPPQCGGSPASTCSHKVLSTAPRLHSVRMNR